MKVMHLTTPVQNALIILVTTIMAKVETARIQTNGPTTIIVREDITKTVKADMAITVGTTTTTTLRGITKIIIVITKRERDSNVLSGRTNVPITRNRTVRADMAMPAEDTIKIVRNSVATTKSLIVRNASNMSCPK